MSAQYAPNNKLSLSEHEPRWFAVYTRYKREKLISQRLREKGIEAYLPLQQFTRHYKRKIRQVEIPLISCYVFTRITRKEYLAVLETPDVVDFVRPSKQLISIPQQEMLLLQRLVGENIELEVEPLSYQPGDEVEIISGNLSGIRGILVAQKNKNNFLIELNRIGYSLRIQADPSLLRKTGSQPSASVGHHA